MVNVSVFPECSLHSVYCIYLFEYSRLTFVVGMNEEKENFIFPQGLPFQGSNY